MLQEPVLFEGEGAKRVRMSVAEYLAMWGDGGTVDGCTFYNYSEDANDIEYLTERLVPAIERLRKGKMLASERANFRDILDYLALRVAALLRKQPVPAPLLESETILTADGESITYEELRQLQGSEPYDMRLAGGDFESFRKAVNQGIDSRLQVCFAHERGDWISGRSVALSAESLPVLVRRLFEGDEDAQSLAQSIVDSLRANKGDAAAL